MTKQDFMGMVRAYQLRHGCPYEEAYLAIRRAKPGAHQDYLGRINASPGPVDPEGSSADPTGTDHQGDEPSGESAKARFNNMIEDLRLQHGWSYDEAFRFMVRRHPSLHKAYLEEANA